MLSRVAERMYWFGRYMERVESMARLIQVYSQLLSDLPKDTGISWHNLVYASGCHSEFERRFTVKDEKRVVRFLLEDMSNPSSLISSLRMVRENIRTTRDVVPAETWELVNEFRNYVAENVQQGVNRRNRHTFLDQVIRTCQQINGLVADTMRRDAAWHFLSLGRNLERGDMSLRTLEAGASMAAELVDDDFHQASDAVWSSVLRTLDAMMSYRRTMRVALNGEDAARFLLEDELLPRAVTCCLLRMDESVKSLPGGEAVSGDLKTIVNAVSKGCDYSTPEKLLSHLDGLQRRVGVVNGRIMETWFQPS